MTDQPAGFARHFRQSPLTDPYMGAAPIAAARRMAAIGLRADLTPTVEVLSTAA